ncbi:MAG: hypothetical protein JNK65_04600 [Deltaproteobacteria bacterium]|nr:hypothetical protein [Deltaproteobacteria bacterium]
MFQTVDSCDGFSSHYSGHINFHNINEASEYESTFLVQVTSHKMTGPKIRLGDYLLIDPQAKIESGAHVLLSIPTVYDFEVRIYFKNSDGSIRLDGLTHRVPPIYLPEDDSPVIFKIVRKICGV